MTKIHYPSHRLRRLRQAGWIRNLVSEYQLSPTDFILPLFVIEGKNKREAIASMPNVHRLSIDYLVETAKEAYSLGIPCIALFPYIDKSLRCQIGKEALNPNNLICRTITALKEAIPDIGIMCDVALDPYTIHGHDGLVQDGKILNDETNECLVQQSMIQVKAGCDIIAPSDMMDGRVQAIRNALEHHSFHDTLIMSYAAKYASCFYAPFRDAIGSQTQLNSGKETYQMNPANTDEALREATLDIEEGADMIMIKPAMLYLDILQRIKQEFKMPSFAYQVSGEYSMLQTAINQDILPEKAILETLLSIKRAGADGILTYHAITASKLLQL